MLLPKISNRFLLLTFCFLFIYSCTEKADSNYTDSNYTSQAEAVSFEVYGHGNMNASGAALFASKNGTELLRLSTRMASIGDNISLSDQTLMGIRSINKQITATAILKLPESI